MSFILEALSKAEQNHSTSNNGNAPQVYPLEKQTSSKGILLLLIATACLTSAIVSLLIIYMTDSNNGASHTETQDTQNSTSTVTREVIGQQSTRQTANSTTIISPAATNKKYNDDYIAPQEPGFSHLISRRNYNKKTKPIIEKPERIKTENAAITTAHTASGKNIETQKNRM